VLANLSCNGHSPQAVPLTPRHVRYRSCPVDLMPGDRDPANFNLPQQPMHPCLFLTARTYSTFNTVTNPHCPEINGVKYVMRACVPSQTHPVRRGL
jgi:hypothetical protein